MREEAAQRTAFSHDNMRERERERESESESERDREGSCHTPDPPLTLCKSSQYSTSVALPLPYLRSHFVIILRDPQVSVGIAYRFYHPMNFLCGVLHIYRPCSDGLESLRDKLFVSRKMVNPTQPNPPFPSLGRPRPTSTPPHVYRIYNTLFSRPLPPARPTPDRREDKERKLACPTHNTKSGSSQAEPTQHRTPCASSECGAAVFHCGYLGWRSWAAVAVWRSSTKHLC